MVYMNTKQERWRAKREKPIQFYPRQNLRKKIEELAFITGESQANLIRYALNTLI